MDRPKLILHAGANKTGTSTFQKAMMEGAAVLEMAGVLYPVGRARELGGGHHRLFWAILDADHRKLVGTPVRKPWPDFQAEYAFLRDSMLETGCRTIVLSSEYLWIPDSFDKEMLLRIREAFADCDILLVVVLRAIPDYAMSAYTQAIMGPQRYRGSFSDYVQTLLRRRILEYADRLSCFAEVFGEASVRAFWYNSNSGSPFPPFMPLLGLDREVLSALPFGPERLNRSLEWGQVAERLALNRLRGMSPLLERAARAAKRLGVSPAMLAPATQDPKQAAEIAMLKGMQERQQELLKPWMGGANPSNGHA